MDVRRCSNLKKCVIIWRHNNSPIKELPFLDRVTYNVDIIMFFSGMESDNTIAIVGVGCRFPGADNLAEFWRVLVNGENHVTDIPKERWNVDAFYDADNNAPGKTYVRKAGFVNK